MRKLVLIIGLLMQSVAYADIDNPLNFEEADGSPTTFPYKVIVSNATLTDNADGTVTLTTGGGGGTPGGANANIQYNNATAFGGDGSLNWNPSTNMLGISRDASQSGYALVVSGDLATQGMLANISHDGTAHFQAIQLNNALSADQGGTGVGTHTDGGVLIGKGTANIENTGAIAKGGIIVGDGVTNPVVLIVGANGTILSADSAEASGVKWMAPSTIATALVANGANCSASNAPLGVDASGAVESCTDFEEELTNSAGLAAALSDETGTSLAVFNTDPALVAPAVSGTPNVAGELGYNATQAMPTTYGGITAVVAPIHGTIATGVGTQTLTNSVSTDQDFTSMFTFPANSIYTNKVYRVVGSFESISGVSSASITSYLKIGTTKVFNTAAAGNIADSLTRQTTFVFYIYGRAAAGAAAAVSAVPVGILYSSALNNTVTQPVNLATNGTLTINFGVTWSATGSTETVEQQGFIIEELN